ncbi:plasmid mobilization relaxosome protein MobC [Flavobacterium rakeshii]|uniref:Plasmid mobilization relaxosome protein MobC n=1 Tax=Flavobacterium rakeshii TaxID=1038845 RepID=A0A6N8HFW0_9FLAO|nr:plasmid mobilization relaxosome protein MobC [Flavobacterium rakeshii]MUV04614.1 plasmid mobilization relaxosome protein MobC [Flavobacterium rakeshii]
METENNNRKRRIYVRLTEKEFTTLESRWKNTTCRSVSEYVRHCLFSKPITTITRDTSTDEAIVQMSYLNRELNAIGSNFNQLVRRVNATSQAAEIKGLLLLFENQRKTLFSKIEEVKEQLQKLAEKWLQ